MAPAIHVEAATTMMSAVAVVAVDMAVGLAIQKATRKHRAAAGKTRIMAIAAGLAIPRAIPKHRAAAGKARIMAIAAGLAILRAILKRLAEAGANAAVRARAVVTIAVHTAKRFVWQTPKRISLRGLLL